MGIYNSKTTCNLIHFIMMGLLSLHILLESNFLDSYAFVESDPPFVLLVLGENYIER